MNFELTGRQTTAFEAIESGAYRVIVFGGAIRGGKTYWLLLTLSYLALQYPRSRWVIIRRSLPDLKRTTFPSFSSILNDGINQYVESWNRDTQVVTFINGSELLREWVDDKAAAPGDLDAVTLRDERSWLQEREAALLYR